MSDPTTHPHPPSRHSWPRAVTILGIIALFLGAGLLVFRMVVGKPGEAIKSIGEQVKEVAKAFHEGTLRTEFLSHASELQGNLRLQVATLKQQETFRREEAGSTAWGLIQVPKVVVQAQAPVEYGYYLDLRGPWEFEQIDKKMTVYPPALQANTPAMDVSALTFYTLAGSIWRDEGAVRERLRNSLMQSLWQRSNDNVPLIREAARRQVAEFVEGWLAKKFGDGTDYQVKVVFPDERILAPPPENPRR